MVYVPATENNINLAHAVNNRIDADGRLIRGQGTMLTARAWLWRLAGLGVFVLALGGGIGLALFGYSYVNDSRTSEAKMGAAIAAALENTTVKLDHQATIGVTGSVDMKPGVVTLAPGSAIVATGSVALEPGGTVHVIESLRPTERQLEGGNAHTASSGGTVVRGKTVTNFTIFKSVVFSRGTVKTGWDFATSEQETPTRQYCYYAEDASDGMQVIMTLATDGQLLEVAHGYKNIDAKAAASQCVWFNGQQTQG